MTMETSRHNARGIGGFVDDLNGAIRENPVAAGLVGMGVLWMLFGGARVSALGGSLPGAARTVTGAFGAAAGATGSAVGDVVAGTASRVSEAARQVGGAISSGAESAATKLRDTASAGYDALSGEPGGETAMLKGAGRSSMEFGREFGMSVQQNLRDTLERQPLLLGAIGLAIGAGIASAFPSTKIEQDMMGQAGAAVKDKLQKVVTETTELASERAKDVVQQVKKEAAAQGLTPDAAKDILKGAGDKLKSAAAKSRDSIKDRFS